LAQQYIEFVARGLDKVEAGMKGLEGRLTAVSKLADAAKVGFSLLTGVVGGFVTAGLAGTGQAERLGQALQSLSREIAGIFLPVVEKVIDGVKKVTSWFEQLSGHQQDQIMRWTAAAGAALFMLAIFPKIVTGITAVIGAIRAVTAALAAAGAASGIATGGLTTIFGIVASLVAAFVGFGAASEEGFGSLSKLIEPIQAAFGRITEAAAPLFAAVDKIGELFTRLIDSAVGPLNFVMGALADVVIVFVDALIVLQSVLSPVVDLLVQFLSFASELASKVANFLAPAFEAMVAPLKEAAAFLERIGLLSRQQVSTKSEPHRKPEGTGGQFEDVQATFRRIQSAVLKSDTKRIDERQLEALHEINESIGDVERAIEGLQPVVA
jgi:phage-related protein